MAAPCRTRTSRRAARKSLDDARRAIRRRQHVIVGERDDVAACVAEAAIQREALALPRFLKVDDRNANWRPPLPRRRPCVSSVELLSTTRISTSQSPGRSSSRRDASVSRRSRARLYVQIEHGNPLDFHTLLASGVAGTVEPEGPGPSVAQRSQPQTRNRGPCRQPRASGHGSLTPLPRQGPARTGGPGARVPRATSETAAGPSPSRLS